MTLEKKKNILFFFPDQHRGDWMPMGEEFFNDLKMDKIPLKMPNLRKLMDKGVTFTRAITPSPLCAPARACLAAGKGYETCGVRNNGDDYDLSIPSFYQVLKEQGYSVGGVGKFDLHKKTQVWGMDGWTDDLRKIGFTDALDNAGKLDAANSGKDKPADPYMKFLDDNGYRKYYSDDTITRKQSDKPTDLPDDLYCDNWIGENAKNMIRGFSKDKPWFLQINFTGPHDPWDITKSMKERWKDAQFAKPHKFDSDKAKDSYDINGIHQNYAAMLENIDRIIGDTIAEVEKRGELENTVIVYASDHGEKLGDWNMFSKGTPHRSSIHIPLVIATPEMTECKVSDSLVELQDLAATFLEIAGGKLKTADDSYSLLPLCKDTHKEVRDSQHSGLFNKRGKWSICQDKKYKITMEDNKIVKVSDLQKDPWADNNLLDTDKDEAIKAIDKLLIKKLK